MDEVPLSYGSLAQCNYNLIVICAYGRVEVEFAPQLTIIDPQRVLLVPYLVLQQPISLVFFCIAAYLSGVFLL